MNILALSGGVGGAKLALGLSHKLASDALTVVVNTADDFTHLGLKISPDLDTLMYTLSGRSNEEQGWGLADESWTVSAALKAIDGPTWFQLGDKDLATHLYRSHFLDNGHSLTQVTQTLFNQMGVSHCVLPMCNEKVSTFVETADGPLDFQSYFVGQQCQPVISDFYFEGVASSSLSAEVQAAIHQCDAVIICPSNPFVSVMPILSIPGFKQALIEKGVPVVVVSPIIDGQAVKGPSAKMMKELGLAVNNASIAAFYNDLASHIVIDSHDEADAAALQASGLEVLVCNTMMRSLDDKMSLAESTLAFIADSRKV